MKKITLLLSALLVVAGVAFAAQATTPQTPAQEPAAAPAAQAPAKATTAMKTHVVEAEVVSADATAKTLTIKSDTGDKTVPVEGAAVAELKNVKAGEKVKLTCRDNAQGEHQAITKIAVEKAPKSK